uniref:Uncharacterized protein n=1 Tax=Eptatretus burgeri TaxID=7764 RepID=A0A8C4R1C8_EPTBU
MDWRSRKGDKRGSSEDRRLFLDPEHADARITDADLEHLVLLPPCIDPKEWLATHAMNFFTLVNLQYSAVSEFCTAESCPSMTACGKIKCSGPQYVDYVLSYIQTAITDERLLPTKYGNSFPTMFEALVRNIFRLLFRILAHLYCCHYRDVLQLDLHAHLNSFFTHFVYFARHFHLLDARELSPVADLVELLCSSQQSNSASSDRDSAHVLSQKHVGNGDWVE